MAQLPLLTSMATYSPRWARLDLRPDLPLVNLISEASRLLGLAAGGHRNLLLIPNPYVAR